MGYLQAFAAPLLGEGPLVKVLKGFRQQGSVEGVVQPPIITPQVLACPISVHGVPTPTGCQSVSAEQGNSVLHLSNKLEGCCLLVVR